jgi:hypothetical protein
MTIYASLRVSELTYLRVSDIDSKREVICVRQGRRRKDGQVMLSPKLLEVLRVYWKRYRSTVWLFPGNPPDRPITRETVLTICRLAGRAAHLSKRISPILCGIASSPICWKTRSTCAASRCCPATATSRPRPNTCTFPTSPYALPSVHWTDYPMMTQRFDESADVGAGRHFPPPRPGLPDNFGGFTLP